MPLHTEDDTAPPIAYATPRRLGEAEPPGLAYTMTLLVAGALCVAVAASPMTWAAVSPYSRGGVMPYLPGTLLFLVGAAMVFRSDPRGWRR